MTGLKAQVVHLYPRWVLSRGNGTLIRISRQPLALFAPLLLQWSLLIIRTPKRKKFFYYQFNGLAGQIKHMAAQKVGFTPRPIRYGPPNWHISSSAALESTYQSWTWNVPVLGPIPWEHAKTVPFLALVSPLWDFGGKQAEPHQSVPVREVLWCVWRLPYCLHGFCLLLGLARFGACLIA